MKTKVIAMYLPQFHRIPENDEFWGKGFTDWISVKHARPLFKGHVQPNVPLNNNYYDLSKEQNVEWQAKLAHDYGIYGFGVYHYWFNNDKNLLTRPAEILRDSKNGYVKYFLVWDNANWKRSWSNVDGNDWAPMADSPADKQRGVKILVPYILGHELDWKNHYNYCRTHFHSFNYDKVDNKPVFCIITYSENIKAMCDYWDELAKQDGFDGMFFIFQHAPHKGIPSEFYQYDYEPHYVGWVKISFARRVYNKLQRMAGIDPRKDMALYDYDKIWRKLLDYTYKANDSSLFPGAFVSYDDTPRRGKKKSKVIVGVTPEKFKMYFHEFVDIVSNQGKKYVFFTAWNEWGEGAYLEPDTINRFKYLEAIKEVMKG
jgi:lipopolysaccharide biosynthesis protein